MYDCMMQAMCCTLSSTLPIASNRAHPIYPTQLLYNGYRASYDMGTGITTGVWPVQFWKPPLLHCLRIDPLPLTQLRIQFVHWLINSMFL